MTANEQRDLFVLLSNMSSLTNRQPDDREVSALLNLAMKEFIDMRVSPDNNSKKKGFEADGIRRLELGSLVTSNVLYFKDRVDTFGDFVRGTYYNGALRNPDLDEESTINNQVGYGTITDADDKRYGVFVEWLDEVLYVITENCDISTGDGNNKTWKRNIPVKPITHDEYNEFITNGYKQPYGNLVWRRDSGNLVPTYNLASSPEFRSSATPSSRTTPIRVASQWAFDGSRKHVIQLIPGKSWEIEKYNMYYVKQPKRIVVDVKTPRNQVNCELHDSVHSEIVQIAVRLYSAASVPLEQKYQIAQNEEKQNE